MTINRITRACILMLLVGLLGTVLLPVASFASTKGRRNTALVLTAGTLYGALRGQNRTALVLGAGSAYAWKRYSDARRNEAYRSGYRDGARSYRYGRTSRRGNWDQGRHQGWSHSRYYRGAPGGYRR